MIDLFETVVLPILQGIGEFLPISSSGHLVIAEEFGGQPPNASYNVLLHLGTLVSIAVVFHRRIIQLLVADRRVIPLLVVGTVPAAVLGLTIKATCESVLESALLAGCMLPLTGALIWWSNRRPDGSLEYRDLNWRQSLLIGVFQSCALLPGLSRSGFTIAAGLMLGLRRDQATTFSFLLAIPAILGASVLEGKDMLTGEAPLPTAGQWVGAAVAAAVGIAALHWLVRWVEQKKLHWFAFWCIPFGCVVVVWQLALLLG